jgi:chemotaxis family two-component system sensor kinase Cph1
VSKPRRPVADLPRADLERRLVECQARYGALVECLPLTTYVAATGVQGSFTFISPQVEALLGYAPREWLADGRLWLTRLHPEDRPRVLPLIARAHKGGESFVAEYRLLDRAGRPLWLRDESRLVRDENGAPLFVQGTWTEIDRRKNLEQETAGRGRELSSTRDQLKQFVSAASHELTAPLRRMVNLADMLKSRGCGRDEETAGMLQRLRASACRLQDLVSALVYYTESAEACEPATRVELEEVFTDVLQELAPAARACGARIVRAPLPPVLGDAARLRRVARTLLDNALKFRGERAPAVAVWAERQGARWVVAVRDNGIGVHPRDAQRIFELFDPVHARSRYEGLGIGLALSKKIIESLGGRLWVDSMPGEGAVFRFSLAAAPGDGG